MNATAGTSRYRAIWISDVHLGTPGCRAELLLDFLACNDSERLYLVGDIIDGWRLRRTWYWPQAHNDVVRKLLRKARQGTKVVYVPGNHDEFARHYLGRRFGRVAVQGEAVHVAADGRRFLIVHGDAFDGAVKYARRLAPLGHWGYGAATTCNQLLNGARRRLGYSDWSLSAYLRRKVKHAVRYIAAYEAAMADVARARGFDGVICGHIHHPATREINGVLYCNDGDWLDSCSALVEHHDGRLEVIHWALYRQLSSCQPALAVSA